jgi:hypothetical protein
VVSDETDVSFVSDIHVVVVATDPDDGVEIGAAVGMDCISCEITGTE